MIENKLEKPLISYPRHFELIHIAGFNNPQLLRSGNKCANDYMPLFAGPNLMDSEKGERIRVISRDDLVDFKSHIRLFFVSLDRALRTRRRLLVGDGVGSVKQCEQTRF